MLLQQLPRLGCRGAAPLALLSASFGAGAEPHLPATTTAFCTTVSAPARSASDVPGAPRSDGAQNLSAAMAAAASELRSAGARACRHAASFTATRGAAADLDCRPPRSTSTRCLMSSACFPSSERSHTATAPSAWEPRSADASNSGGTRTPLGGVRARGYSATAPPPRDPRFVTLEETDLDAFRGMLGANNVLTDASALQAVNKCDAPEDTNTSSGDYGSASV